MFALGVEHDIFNTGDVEMLQELIDDRAKSTAVLNYSTIFSIIRPRTPIGSIDKVYTH